MDDPRPPQRGGWRRLVMDSGCRVDATCPMPAGGHLARLPRLVRLASDGQDAAMAIRQLNPYLNFDGTGGKAIELYQRALGAKVETMQRFGDMPGNQQPPENKDRIMHALLRLDGVGVIMISDTMPGHPLPLGTNVHLTLDFDDEADMAARFDALAAGGKVTMPLQDTFWGARFGMLIDAYGIPWMFNCNKKPA